MNWRRWESVLSVRLSIRAQTSPAYCCEAVVRPKELEPVKCSRDRKHAVCEERPVSKPQGSLLLSSDAEGGACLGAGRKD